MKSLCLSSVGQLFTLIESGATFRGSLHINGTRYMISIDGRGGIRATDYIRVLDSDFVGSYLARARLAMGLASQRAKAFEETAHRRAHETNPADRTSKTSGMDLAELLCSSADFHGSVFSQYHAFDAVLHRPVLCDSTFIDCTFRNVAFSQALLQRSRFINCRFDRCDFREVNDPFYPDKDYESEMTFDGCVLTDTSFDRSDLSSSTFSNCTLRDVGFWEGSGDGVATFACQMIRVRGDKPYFIGVTETPIPMDA